MSEKCQYACARGLVALSDETNGLENLPEYYLPDDIIITTALFAWSRTGVAAGACHDLHTVIRFIHLDCNITSYYETYKPSNLSARLTLLPRSPA